MSSRNPQQKAQHPDADQYEQSADDPGAGLVGHVMQAQIPKEFADRGLVVQGMSTQGHTMTSDKDGQVIVNVQEIVGAKWGIASKSGYENHVINLSEPWSEVIVLKENLTPNKVLKRDN